MVLFLDEEIKWLTRRAKGGFGIITTAAAHVSKDGQGWDGELGLFDDMHIDKLTTLTDSIHTHGSLSFAQLFHGGMRAPQYLTAKPPPYQQARSLAMNRRADLLALHLEKI